MNTTLSTASPYITVADNSGSFGTIPIDTTKENAGDPYVIQASSSTPNGQVIPFQLIGQEAGFADTFDFSLTVGSLHYLVWNPDLTPSSGRAIDSLLRDLNYSGTISSTLPAQNVLEVYRAVFVCAGVYPNNHVILSNSSEAATLVEYANAGGRIYMEGGDVWYYDPLVNGYDFCPLFGIIATADGSGDMGPVCGQTGVFTNQMDFAYAGENNYMDHISAGGTGAFLIFKDGDSLWDCGVARTGTYRSVGTSFELGSLVDGSGVSTRRALVDSIMKFFRITLGVSEGTGGSHLTLLSLYVTPNPFRGQTDISYNMGHGAEKGGLKIFDASGRLVNSFALRNTPCAVHWTGTDRNGRAVPAGIYFIRLEVDESSKTEKVILVR